MEVPVLAQVPPPTAALTTLTPGAAKSMPLP